MSRKNTIAIRWATTTLLLLLFARPAFSITVGGWNSTRGGDSGILAGGDLAAVRADLTTYFPGTTLAESDELTSTFLNSIDVLAISPVFSGASVAITPLSAAEQSALTSWVSGGGRALVVGENGNYIAASITMINPFGPQWAFTNASGPIPGTITDHSSFPSITDGPFGVVNTYSGGYVAWFQNVSPATSLGTWNFNNQTSLAAMNYGSGKVVFFGDNLLLYDIDPNNSVLRRNTLTHLLNVAPSIPYDYNHNGLVDAADYVVWRKTFGQTGDGLAADGNHNNEIDPVDYDLWRAHFGQSTVIGSGATGSASASPAVPEPTSLMLLALACLAGRRCRGPRRPHGDTQAE